MPSFDIVSESDMVALKDAIDVAARQIGNRYDFKGTSAAVEFSEKDKTITVFGDSDFQLDQVKAILFPELEKKEHAIKAQISNDLEEMEGAGEDEYKVEKIKSGMGAARTSITSNCMRSIRPSVFHPAHRRNKCWTP